MGKSKSEVDSKFYIELITKSAPLLIFVFGVAVWNLWLAGKLIPTAWIAPVVFLIALFKTAAIIKIAFHQLAKIIVQSHILTHVVVLFAFLIGLIIFSFASDFSAIFLVDATAFKTDPLISPTSLLSIFFECLYFSTVTFSAIGYGDIVPANTWVKALIMLEVILYFFVLVFGIANINGIKIDDRKHNHEH